jgi:HK97 family phage major capsid protein
MTLKELRQAHAKAADKLIDLAAAGGEAYNTQKSEVQRLAGEIQRTAEAQELAMKHAVPVGGQELPAITVPAQVKGPDYPVGRMLKSLYQGQGNIMLAAQWAAKAYGEGDPVFKSLSTSSLSAGGATVPEDFSAMVIELLRPATVVRASNPIVLPMPRGTMRMPKQTGTATGGYGAEGSDAAASQPATGNIVANFKKLSVLTPISNDWLRYTSPATDQLAQNDIVQSLARTEDLAFLRGDGTMDWPKGMRSFAPAGNLIASNQTPTLDTVDSELTQAIDALAEANVPMLNPVWFFRPKIKQFLLSLKNSNGFYVFKDEMVEQKTLKGIPFKDTTTIPGNLGSGGKQTEVTLTDMSQALIFDAMQLSLAISQEASYKDADGNTVSSFTRDETLIRAIAEHDFHMRHDEAVAVITGVVWA